MGEEFPFLRALIPLLRESVEKGHLVFGNGEVLRGLDGIDILFGPGTRAKSVDGVGIERFAARGDIVDNDQIGRLIEACGESPAGGGAIVVDAADSGAEG